MKTWLVILVLMVLILLSSNVVFITKYINNNILTARRALTDSIRLEKSRRVVLFLKLVSEKVLQSEKEVGFEDRLQLENSIRDLKDESLLALWKNFVDSKDDREAQDYLKDLLEALINKIEI